MPRMPLTLSTIPLKNPETFSLIQLPMALIPSQTPVTMFLPMSSILAL